MAELVDAPDLGSGGSGRVGSSPIRRTTEKDPGEVRMMTFPGLFLSDKMNLSILYVYF